MRITSTSINICSGLGKNYGSSKLQSSVKLATSLRYHYMTCVLLLEACILFKSFHTIDLFLRNIWLSAPPNLLIAEWESMPHST